MKLFFRLTLTMIFLWIAVLGVCFGMVTHSMGEKMFNCPIMNMQPALCPMQAAQLIGGWKQLFSAPLVKDLLIVLTGALLLVLFNRYLSPPLLARPALHDHVPRLYQRAHADYRLYNYLLGLFSSGILQPKVYAAT